MTELHTCPFCGSNDLAEAYEHQYVFISCCDCEAQGPANKEASEDEALEKAKQDWNRRVAHEQP